MAISSLGSDPDVLSISRLDVPADILAVKRLISDHEKSVATLADEIEALMQGVRHLRFRMSKHQEVITHCRGLITLARRMPPEILATIFEYCAYDGWARAPLVVSHVCSEWRKAAEIPTVWSNLYVNLDSRDPYGRTLFWLNKSQNSPLDITLNIRNSVLCVPGVMDLLLLNRRRWRTLTIVSRVDSHASDILHRCRGSFPNLRSLDIFIEEEFVIQEDDEHGAFVGLRGSFRGSLQLRTFIISRNVLPSMGDIPSSITNLSINLHPYSITPLSITSLMDVLEGLPLLRKLSISMSDASATLAANEMRTVTLPDLESLTLAGKPDLYALLPNVYTPSLRSLSLKSPVDSVLDPEASSVLDLVEWLERSSPPLELLELRDSDLSADSFIACFAALPYLRKLRLHDSEILDSVLQSLHGPLGFCPKLAELDLRWCGQVTGRALVDLVRSRLIMLETPEPAIECSSIASVTVINCSFVGEQDVIDLARHTICRVVRYDTDYDCRATGCCENERYRRRLKVRRLGANLPQGRHNRIIL